MKKILFLEFKNTKKNNALSLKMIDELLQYFHKKIYLKNIKLLFLKVIKIVHSVQEQILMT